MAVGHVHRNGHRSMRTCYDLARKGRQVIGRSGLSSHMGTEVRLEETGFLAAYCKK